MVPEARPGSYGMRCTARAVGGWLFGDIAKVPEGRLLVVCAPAARWSAPATSQR